MEGIIQQEHWKKAFHQVQTHMGVINKEAEPGVCTEIPEPKVSISQQSLQ